MSDRFYGNVCVRFHAKDQNAQVIAGAAKLKKP
jgi:hypothetical protein